MFAEANWKFTCVGRTTVVTELFKSATDPSRKCNISLGAITAASDSMRNGVQFPVSTYEGSLQLLIFVPDGSMSIWTFMQPFSVNLWLALFATAAAVALSVFLQEVSWQRILERPVSALQKLANMQFDAAAVTIQIMAEFRARRVGARITILGFSFLVLIIINTYTAALASRLTVRSIKLVRNSLKDLADQPVGVMAADIEGVREHTPLTQPVPLDWETPEGEATALSRLRSGELSALLMESAWVQYQAATTCDLYVANSDAQDVLAFRYGFAFSRDFNSSVLEDVSKAMAEMVEEGVLNDLEMKYIKPPSSCPSKMSPTELVMMQLGVQQMSGLWIFLGATMAAGWAIDGGVSAWRAWKRRRVATAPRTSEAGSAPAAGTFLVTSCDSFAHGRRGGAKAPAPQKGASRGSIKVHPDGTDRDHAVSPMRVTDNGGRVISESGVSLRSLSSHLEGRSRSFFGRPEVADSWMAVADASTVEETVELLKMQVLHMDDRLRTSLAALERRIEEGQLRMSAAVEDFAAALAAGAAHRSHAGAARSGRVAAHGSAAAEPDMWRFASAPPPTPLPSEDGFAARRERG